MGRYGITVCFRESGQIRIADIPALDELVFEADDRRGAVDLASKQIRGWLGTHALAGEPVRQTYILVVRISAFTPGMSVRHLNRIYRSLFFVLADLLWECQPVPIHPEVPDDEFYSEASLILDRLDEATSPERLAEVMHDVFAQQFSTKMADPVGRFTEVANEFWRACQRYHIRA